MPTDADTGQPDAKPDTGDPSAEAEKWKALARKHEASAAKNADAAKQLADMQAAAEARKSDDEKIADRLAKLEAENASARAEALRLRVAAKHGVSAEDAELFLTGADEETLSKQAQRLVERVQEQKRSGNVVPSEGKHTPPPGTDELREFTRQLFNRE